MVSASEISLREYIRLSSRKTNPIVIDEYDAFLVQLWDFFSLRGAAEDYFERNRHVAKSQKGALPLPWQEVRRVLSPSDGDGAPPELLICRIAKKNYADVDVLVRSMRKVLARVRSKIPIGRVQQVDAHCLRWLTRQPGRSSVEKAGSRQQILGVVRVENYDTLENRVLKDFLERCSNLASIYLRMYEKRWNGHETIRSVVRFKNLCSAALLLGVMDSIRSMHEIPQPNYVLQQDKLYSKVWDSYCKVLRQEDVAERLWSRRQEVDQLYGRCMSELKTHCSPRAKYDTPLWFNDLDGRNDIIEAPIWKNELLSHDVLMPLIPTDQEVILDLTEPWDNRDQLVYPANHPNAKPFIQNQHRPSLEPASRTVRLAEIISTRDTCAMADYLCGYYGLLRGKQWFILVPDHWDAQWCENVVGSRPSALPRSAVYLMWRSVAAALGAAETGDFREGDELFVSDGYGLSRRNNVLIRFMRDDKSGRIIPQRASPRLHGADAKNGEPRFWLREKHDDCSHALRYATKSRGIVVTGTAGISFSRQMSGRCLNAGSTLFVPGVKRFVRERSAKMASYFDELDALQLVVQNEHEEVEFKTLIEHQECWPGGAIYTGSQIAGGSMDAESSEALINLLEGEPDDAAPLKQLKITFEDSLTQKEKLTFAAEITPGQGLATIMLTANFLSEPKLLNLADMRDSEYTKLRIEQEMERHFPPTMPYVEASESLWRFAKQEVMPYLNLGRLTVSEKGAFYKPRDYYDNNAIAAAPGLWGTTTTGRQFDEKTMSPIDRLKRENVFGNNPENSVPVDDFDFTKLFERLAKDYASGRDVIRLMAWTYQHENPLFEKARCDLYRRYVLQHANLIAEETSFCSNSFHDGDVRISKFVEEALYRIIEGTHKDDDYRLVYNLLQFHPSSAQNLSTEICTDAFRKIIAERYVEDAFYVHTPFGRQWGGKRATMLLGFIVKTLLFLLHRRRYDASFLKLRREWTPKGFFGQQIPHDRPAKAIHDATREAVIAYVNGRGKLKGIPNS